MAVCKQLTATSCSVLAVDQCLVNQSARQDQSSSVYQILPLLRLSTKTSLREKNEFCGPKILCLSPRAASCSLERVVFSGRPK